MKKLFALVLCVLLIGALAVTAFAADTAKVTVTADKTTVNRGDTVKVSVTVTGASTTSLTYAPKASDVYDLVSGTVGASIDGNTVALSDFSTNMGEAGGVKFYDGLVIAFKSATALNGEVCSFELKIKDDAPIGSVELTDVVVVTGAQVDLTDATITVACKHEFGKWTNAGDKHAKTCSICGAEETAAHAFDAGKVTKEPDCKNPGEKTKTCADCGATTTESIPSTGKHAYGAATKVDEKNHKQVCTGCGEEKVTAHAFDAGKVTKEPTCKDTGILTKTCADCKATTTETVPVTTNHTYGAWEKADELSHAHVCTVCGKTESAQHAFDAGKVTKEPTCKDTGILTKTCADCKATATETIPVTEDHTYGAWEKVDAENHKSACTVCGKETTAAHEFALVSNEETHWEECACGEKKEAVAHEFKNAADEKTHWTECVCGVTTQGAAHTWDEGKVTTEPTTEKEGVKTFTCADCGATKTEAVDKLTPPKTPATGDNNMNVALVVLAVLATCGLALSVIGKKRIAR